jgi:carbon storage regulator
MLVLSRKKNECIIINDNIVVTVIEIRGDKVRLGIEAPKDVTVHRREVYEAIHGQNPPPPPPRDRGPGTTPVGPDAGASDRGY